MTRREKLIERLSRGQPRSAFADVRSLLEQHGWVLARQKGSHVTFTKRGARDRLPSVGRTMGQAAVRVDPPETT